MDHGDDSQPQPDMFPVLLRKLRELLALQKKFQPNLTLPVENNGSEVTVGLRDGSAHILRCLKVWYELPSDVLFISVNIIDRFLTKMKVKPKHIACISIASFHIACKMICSNDMVPEISHLITISQCKCTVSDLTRMESVVISKLGFNFSPPVTSLSFLRLFHDIMSSTKHSDLYERVVNKSQMFQRLEVIACDTSCANFDACQVALALLCSQIDIGVARLSPTPYAYIGVLSIIEFVTELQQHSQISEDNFYDCLQSVLKIIKQYNAQSGLQHRQRLVWRLSHRTLRHLRPTNKLMSTLPTIEEQCQ